MSRFGNWGENQLADFIRGEPSILNPFFEFALLSAFDEDGSPEYTRLSGTDYADQTIARSLANFAGTQGAGTTLASNGTSHRTSNNIEIDFGLVGAGGWGTLRYVGLFSEGNLFAVCPVSERVLLEGDSVVFAPGSLQFTLGLIGGLSNYFSNKLIDEFFRNQTFAMPSLYLAYTKTTPTNAAGGTEPNVGGYARVPIPASLDSWGPTQGGFASDPSNGTSGRISNADALAFPAPTADQGVATHLQLMDAALAGRLMFWCPLDNPITVLSGGPAPTVPQDFLSITFE